MPSKPKNGVRKTFPIELDEHLHKNLKHQAIERDMSLHDYILDVLGSTVAEEPPAYAAKQTRKHRP